MVAHGLPMQPTPFIGRTQELTAIYTMLGEPTCRLMTLVGPGGIGKTRLALEVAQHTSLPVDVYYVPLQPLSSPDSIVSTIAEVLKLQFHSGGDPRQQLLDDLREKSLLLILDNYEHLLEGVSLLTDILATATRMRLLVTSRERLNVREECVLDVHGLPYPASANDSTLETYDAVNLFLLHARRARSDFALTAAHIESVSRICRIVEGMPLGIELAAARVRVLSCEAIADEMARSLDILETPARNVEPRHRNMRAAFDPTWQRLSDDERAVFRKLSVFRGGFTREAAESVAGASLVLLSSLVDKSLVRLQANGRYDLHELLRQYSAEQLNQSPDERDQTRDLHCAYYAALLDQQWSYLNGADQNAPLQVIEADIENVRLGWQRAVQQKNGEAIGRFLDSLWFFYDARCWFDEGEKALAHAAQALEASISDAKIGLVYGKILAREGFFCILMMQLKRARALIEKSLTILRALDAPQEVAYALQKLAHVHHDEGDVAGSNQLLQQSLLICRETGDLSGAAWSLYQLGLNAFFLDNFAEAQQFCQEGQAVYSEIGSASGLSSCLSIEGWACYHLESFAEAKRLFREQILVSDQAGNRWDMMHGRLGLALALIALGAYAESVTPLYDGLSRAIEIGVETVPAIPMVLAEVMPECAALLVNRGRKVQAVEFLALTLHQTHWSLTAGIAYRARRLFAQLQAEMPSNTFLAAVERAETLNMKSVVMTFLPQLQAMQHDFQALSAQPADSPLSEREIEVLRLVADDMDNREIAEHLVIAVSTVKWYINEIFRKLNVNRRAKAVSRARALNLIANDRHSPDSSTY